MRTPADPDRAELSSDRLADNTMTLTLLLFFMSSTAKPDGKPKTTNETMRRASPPSSSFSYAGTVNKENNEGIDGPSE